MPELDLFYIDNFIWHSVALINIWWDLLKILEYDISPHPSKPQETNFAYISATLNLRQSTVLKVRGGSDQYSVLSILEINFRRRRKIIGPESGFQILLSDMVQRST